MYIDIYRTYDTRARDEAFTGARALDLFFRGGGFALLRFYGIAHRRESERAGGSGGPAIFRISIADGRAERAI